MDNRAKSLSEQLNSLTSLMDEVDILYLSLDSDLYFKKEEVKFNLDKNNHQLNFYRLVSWLYIFYYEIARKGIRAIKTNLNVRKIEHYKNIHKFRTYLQHHINASKEEDYEKKREFHVWLKTKCNTALPETQEKWSVGVNALLSEAIEFLIEIKVFLKSCEEGENKEYVIKGLKDEFFSSLDVWHIDGVIKKSSLRLGMPVESASIIRKGAIEKWKAPLRNLVDKKQREEFIIKLIEKYLIEEYFPKLVPLNGHDIIKTFEVKEGKEIRIILDYALEEFKLDDSVTKSALLDKIRVKFFQA